MFFQMSTFVLAIVLIVIVAGTAAVGVLIGRKLRGRPGANPDTIGVIQGTLLGLVGLLLAFGLTMAVGRYETRRASVVAEANDIGTTYLRAQLLAEPERTTSLDLLKTYGDQTVALAQQVPDSDEFDATAARIEDLQRDLWSAAGDAVAADPVGTAPRLYIETLNDTIDAHTDRTTSLRNRVPTPVILLQLAGSALALGVLSVYLTMLGRGLVTSLVAGAVIVLILFISFDLDRPQRGFITVPATPLIGVRASMDQPPAADGP